MSKKLKITDAGEILSILNQHVKGSGHFCVKAPDGEIDDYDMSVPDYWVKQEFGPEYTECVDSNGSDCDGFYNLNGVIKFDVLIDQREYQNEDGETVSWEDRDLVCTIKEIIFDKDAEYDFDRVQIILESIVRK